MPRVSAITTNSIAFSHIHIPTEMLRVGNKHELFLDCETGAVISVLYNCSMAGGRFAPNSKNRCVLAVLFGCAARNC